MSFLRGENMVGGYGGADILKGCTIAVEKGEIVVIVGPNGAGKSTAMKAVFGMLDLREGRVLLGDDDITALSPQERVRRGMGFVPQTSNVFSTMTVMENLEMGAYVRTAWRQREETMQEVFDLFPILRERQKQLARTLSGGERQMLAVGRALMSQPKLCLFDEPSIGLAPLIVTELFHVVQRLRERGITVLLIEQNVRRSLEIADRAYVLESGQIVLSGPSAALLREEQIRKAYLGL